MTSKKELSERDICTKYIQPALEKAGWNPFTQIREEVSFTDGRIYVKGNLSIRGKRKRADYILYYKPNIPIAIIEAKDNRHSVKAGIQQGLNYAEILDIPTVYSSNGDGFYEHDRTCSNDKIEKELALDEFPTPDSLWQRYKKYKGIETREQERITAQDYFFDGSGRAPRYYQQIAINRTVEAIAKGQNRILLTMATGTGKTYTAFQIIHRLWKSNTKKRILFLADRNVLIDQARRGDFRHFKDKMTVIKKRKIDKSYEIYLALYQGLINYNEDKDAYREFSPGFFDLIIIDECHRGSAAIVLPDGSLTGDGVKERIRKKLLEDCNLHTIIRLPNSVFQPYASVATNLLFFTKGEKIKTVWYYEHKLPEGYKAYSKTKPIRLAEFDGLKKWWAKRKKNEQAWKVDIGTIKKSGYNLDIKNPHQPEPEKQYSSGELLEMLHQSFGKSDKLLSQLRKELADG